MAGRRLGAVALLFLVAGACSEATVDPEQERNVRPGLRPEGTPRDEEA